MKKLLAIICAGFLVLPTCLGQADAEGDLAGRAEEALRRAVDFFRSEVSTQGGYLWRYSEDLATREGEGKATDTQVWVQPPGTPAIGLTFLKAHEATGDSRYLDAAVEAAEALVQGQLRSGGWEYRIEFDPEKREAYAYLVDPPRKDGRNTSTLDDNTTQSALRLLMRVDQALDFKDTRIHGAVRYALHQLLAAQYPNGAWPQRFTESPDPRRFPVKKAGYPESWPRIFPKKKYRSFYTFNDNTIGDTIGVMLEAGEIYGKAKFREAAERAGGFILLAQMPDPQPAWAQQYNSDMHPAWARSFEPPSVTGGESQGVMRTLLMLYRATGEAKYLEPIPRAVEYFRNSRLPDGRLARFYELETNKPLFFTKEYELTYSDADMPTHYNFKPNYGIEEIAEEYERVKAMDLESPEAVDDGRALVVSEDPVSEAIAAIDSQDDRGRWVDDGRLRYHGDDDPTRRIIDCKTFIANVNTLSEYLAIANEGKRREDHCEVSEPEANQDGAPSMWEAVCDEFLEGLGFGCSPLKMRRFSLEVLP